MKTHNMGMDLLFAAAESEYSSGVAIIWNSGAQWKSDAEYRSA